MGSSVQRRHRTHWDSRWVPLSVFNLDTIFPEPPETEGLQVRKRGLAAALGDEGIFTLPPHLQDILDALYWQRYTVAQVARGEHVPARPEREATLEELLWSQFNDDPGGTIRFMRAREPDWRPPEEVTPPRRESLHHEVIRRLRNEALGQLQAWCERWVASELVDELEEAS